VNLPTEEPGELDDTRAFGRLLRYWRQVYRVSQEELASRLDSASRHISRLEKGRAHPTRKMVSRIAQSLSLGERDTHLLLLSAGYVPTRRTADIHSFEFRNQREELLRGLRALDPHPALVVDITGAIIMVNKAWVGFVSELVPDASAQSVHNIFDLLFGFAGAHSHPQEWDATLAVLLLSLQQTALFSESERIASLLEHLLESPAVPNDWALKAAQREAGRRFYINSLIDGQPQRFFTHSQIFNLRGPLDFIAQPDLITLTFFPEQEGVGLQSLLNHSEQHPLLFYT